MSSMKENGDPDDPVVCSDTSDDVVIINDSIDDNINSETDIVSLEQTLPPGVAPDGFIIIDETDESDKIEEPEIKLDDDVEKDDDKPMFKIIFRDETVSRLYKKRVRNFFHRLIAIESRDDTSPDDLVLQIWSKKKEQEKTRKRPHDNEEGELINDNTDEDDNMLFTIDNRPTLQCRLDVPTYGKKFEKIMDSTSGTTQNDNEDDKSACRPKMTCWNCSGNHLISDCQEPRNQMMIMKNRNEFANSKAAPKMGRYHVENNGQRFDHIVPGKLSRDLRKALGINDNELPQHIYRMRKLGYPPGWLKEAKLEHSGMNLYTSDGSSVSDRVNEPGQIIESEDMDQYDVQKIQEFPGFNVRPPSGTKEMDKRYWKSEHYTANSKTSLLASLHDKKVDGYKRRKLARDVAPVSNDDPEPVPIEMDLEEEDAHSEKETVVENVPTNGLFVPPLPKSPPRDPLPPEPEDAAVDSSKPVDLDLDNSVSSPAHVDSPSLADLEQCKKQLLEELDDSSVPSPLATPVTSRLCSSTNTPKNEATSQSVKQLCNLGTPSRGTVKSVDLGTPILESTSPYNKLPSVDKFAKDICDVIHFENLPDSTGKYQKMTGILQKVRTTLATTQLE